MDNSTNNEGVSAGPEKPVQQDDDVKFPPFPEPTDTDFEEDISEEERNYYKDKFPDLNLVKTAKLHCTACDRHLGCSARNDARMRAHPMLRTLVCHTCHTFYNSGEFDKGDDGSELYCRLCGQGGQVYCCSNCPHVFCAKCIKRNFGLPKIREIENTEDWKCFKCNSKPLWYLRAVCWALLRYVDLKNKITYKTEDHGLKEKYQKDCAIDYTDCCKHKARRRDKPELIKKKDDKKDVENITKKIISKIPPTIQVKKFASINLDEVKQERKPLKRPSSPRNKPPYNVKTPIALMPGQKVLNPVMIAPSGKKIKLSSPLPVIAPIRYPTERKSPANMVTYQRIRSRNSVPISNFNGLNTGNNFNNSNSFNNMFSNINMVVNDNINLSLDSLTQGLDMAAVTTMNNNQDDDVVCTPDFPLEPLCEVTEDNDDDVECITSGPVVMPKISNPPPLVTISKTSEISNENIIQMTENDVTVNADTGGLKFRVDPQTLSSNKMYRLPDGRIFAINANPNMPGGYSATIVAVADNAEKTAPKGATYAAKVSAVMTTSTTPISSKSSRIQTRSMKRSTPKPTKSRERHDGSTSRRCDMSVPVEWFRYNLLDAIDSLEYSLSRLHKLKKETSSTFLRSRSVEEMRKLHRNLERLLNTSSNRFIDIRENLQKDFKKYVSRKEGNVSDDDDDDEDDDIEILPDMYNEEPIFIDENSIDSANVNDNQEVDLTGAASSECNDSGENKNETKMVNIAADDDLSNVIEIEKDSIDNHDEVTEESSKSVDISINNNTNTQEDDEDNKDDDKDDSKDGSKDDDKEDIKDNLDETKTDAETSTEEKDSNEVNIDDKEQSNDKDTKADIDEEFDEEKDIMSDKVQDDDEKMQDNEMSEEMIETLLKDDNTGDDVINTSQNNAVSVSEILGA